MTHNSAANLCVLAEPDWVATPQPAAGARRNPNPFTTELQLLRMTVF